MTISEQAIDKFKSEKFLVLGLGRSGKAAAEVLNTAMVPVKVYEEHKNESTLTTAGILQDQGIEVFFKDEVQSGSEVLTELLEGSSIVVPSPGISDKGPLMAQIISSGKMIWSEIELAYELADAPFIIAVTGTNGKTTTTELITSILQTVGLQATAAGNIGHPFIKAVEEGEKGTIFCVEVSSFQLSHVEKFKPNVAVLLNISEDHLDWHRDIQEYIQAKGNLYKNLTAHDVAVLNEDCDYCGQIDTGNAKVVTFSSKGIRGMDYDISGSKLLGQHNQENMYAAVASVFAAATMLGIELPDELLHKAIADFKPSEHRLEPVDIIEGIAFINDSKSTNPDSVVRAVQAMDKNFVLIAGGRNKGNSFEPMKHILSGSERVSGVFKGAVLIGESAFELSATLSGLGMIAKAESLDTAVSLAFDLALNVKEGAGELEGSTDNDLIPGDAVGYVLFSPGCASFDMFKSYEDRGHQYKQAVAKLRHRIEEGKKRKREIKAARDAAGAALENGSMN